MDDVLARVDDWPVDTVAVGVTTAEAPVATHGPTARAFPLASVTKPLTAWATLVAVQDAAVHLDEPAGPPDSTVRHLLAHASGLPPDAAGPGARVGTRRIYSNVGFDVLGDVVADRVGRAFADHLALEVTEPLGMDDTHLDGSPAHGAHGTLDDLLAFARELLAPTLVDDDLATEATTVQFPDLAGVLPGFGRQDPNDWGLGLELRGDKAPHWTGADQPPATFGHFGQSGAFLWVDPGADVATACLADRPFDAWATEVWPAFNDAVHAAATGR